VRRVLATEDRARLGHLRLDEGVPHAGTHWGAAQLGDDLRDGLRGNEVVDNRRARVLAQVAFSDHRADRGRADRVTVFVDDEATVGVTVEGDAQVAAVIHGEL